MTPKSQSLSSSRWATTSRNTSTVNRFSNSVPHYNNISSLSKSRSPSPTKRTISKADVLTLKEDTPLTEAQRSLSSKFQSYQVFSKYLRRLKWKSTMLLHSYSHTLAVIHSQDQSPVCVVGGVPFHMQLGDAEVMFKIDFFEFYSILENTLVHLLKVFGVGVSAMYGTDIRTIEGDGSRQHDGITSGFSSGPAERAGLIGDSKIIQKSRHRFHANVLLAVDDVNGPLKEIMGQGKVRDYLGIAKEWRNKWKNVEEEGKDERNDGLIGSRYEKMIKDLNLEEMLKEILVAAEHGATRAQETLTHMNHDIVQGGLSSYPMEIDMNTDETTELLTAEMMDWDC